MSVYKRGPKWAVYTDLEREPNKPRRRKYFGTYNTKREAQAFERRMLEERDRGIDLAPGKVTVAETLERWQRDRVSRVEAKTAQEDTAKIRLHVLPALGAIPLAKLKPAHLADLYALLLDRGRANGKGGLSPKTVHHVHSLIKTALSWAVRMGLASRNVADAVESPKVLRGEPRAIPAEEVARLLQAASNVPLGALITLAFATGARRGELLALKWNAVDLQAASMLVRFSMSETQTGIRLKAPKSDRIRTVSLSRPALEALRRQRARQAEQKLIAGSAYQDQGFVFADALGGPLTPSLVSGQFRELANKCGISTTRLHDARHTAATWLIAEGVDVRTVGAVLGHSVASTTLNIYAHAIAGAQTAAVGKLGDRLDRTTGDS